MRRSSSTVDSQLCIDNSYILREDIPSITGSAPMLSFEEQKRLDALVYRRSWKGSNEWVKKNRKHHRNKMFTELILGIFLMLFGTSI